MPIKEMLVGQINALPCLGRTHNLPEIPLLVIRHFVEFHKPALQRLNAAGQSVHTSELKCGKGSDLKRYTATRHGNGRSGHREEHLHSTKRWFFTSTSMLVSQRVLWTTEIKHHTN